MTSDPPALSYGSSRPVYQFGEFILYASERRLEKAGVALKVGARAFDILRILLEHAGQPVSKSQLGNRVWPDVTVGESSLRFQMVALRKLLGDPGEDGAPIATLAGRGYSFVAPVRVHHQEERLNAGYTQRPQSLPAHPTKIVGRMPDVAAVTDLLALHRFATLVGPGGVGKTTLAVTVAHRLCGKLGEEVHFIDLSASADPAHVGKIIAISLGLPLNVEDPRPAILNRLLQRPTLIVLDSCEHLVDAVAEMAEMIHASSPSTMILATSREALRAEGEWIHQVGPLAYPATDIVEPPEILATYPAIELLVERATAAGSPLKIDAATGPLLSEICRQLDGMALAIEIAASRVPSYGLRGTLTQLEDRFRFLTGGRRTAVVRHRALSDTIGWSYDLLDDATRVAFHRLSVLVGEFDLESAVAMIAGADFDPRSAIDAVGSLAEKSLLAVAGSDGGARYRLLDTTRAYALERLVESGEWSQAAQRHARFFATRVAETQSPRAISSFAPNLRAALAWCFGEGEDIDTGIRLAVKACPLLLARSQLTDCVRFSRAALATSGANDCDPFAEMVLNACLGQALMFTEGNTPEAEEALSIALRLSENHGDIARRLKLAGALHIFYERIGDYNKALMFAELGLQVAERIGDPAAIAAANSLLGISHHLMGDHAKTDRHLGIALAGEDNPYAIDPIGFGFNHRNRARITMARSHFLQGRAAAAERIAGEAVEEAARLGHPVTYAIALIWAIEVGTWQKDWASVENLATRLEIHAERNSLRPYPAISKAAKGMVALKMGEAADGLHLLTEASKEMSSLRYELVNSVTGYHIAEGLLLTGNLSLATSAIEENQTRVQKQGDWLHLPEILRIKGEILSAHPSTSGLARAAFLQAIEVASSQGSTFWELRSAISLARHDQRSGNLPDAELLRLALDKFEEPEDIEEVREAKEIMEIY